MAQETHESLFRAWLEEHSGIVLKIARVYTWNAEDCQDLCQEILLQVWRSLPKYQGRASSSTWIYRIALNTALVWRRRERRHSLWKQTPLEPELIESTQKDSCHELQRRERLEQLYDGIRRLSKADAALVLLFLEDLSYREISEVLGISETHVGVKLTRARKALSEMMKEAVNEPG